MTLSTTSNTITYVGNNAATTFTFAFLIPDASSVVVTLADIAAGTTQVLDPSLYSITGLDNPAGGNVTYPLSGSPIDTNHSITIQREVALVQETTLSNQSAFYPVTVEDALDYLTMITQQLNEKISRALSFPVGTDTDIPTLMADILNAAANATAAAASAAAAAASAAAAAAFGFQTGDVMWQDNQGARSAWVRDNGLTIGNVGSGATERANADCQNLFTFLWNTYSDTICPVVGGRGANAAADWAALKKITMPDKRGRSPIGLDDMGNVAANRFTGVPFTSGTSITPGSVCGEPTHVGTIGEMATHTHIQNSHAHTYATPLSVTAVRNDVPAIVVYQGLLDGTNNTGATTAVNQNTGGGTASNITHLCVLGTWYRKL